MTAQEVDAVAIPVARTAKARAWWAELEELVQVARLAVLEAGRRCLEAAYLATAARIAVQTALGKAWCPVSVGAKSGAATRLRFASKRGEAPEQASQGPCPAERANVRRVALKVAGGWPLGLQALLGDGPAEVAQAHQVPVRGVYRQVELARRALQASPRLRELAA